MPPVGEEASVDLVFSNLMLPWCHDPETVLREFRRVLRRDGLLSFATFGPDTLRELRDAWAGIDGHTHVNYFYDMHDIGAPSGYRHYRLYEDFVEDLVASSKLGSEAVPAFR